MDLATYQEKFVEFTKQAKKLSAQCKTSADLQKKISELCTDAADFYYKNSNHKESDYALKIKIFLDFDTLLKEIKRNFVAPSNDKKRNVFFTSTQEAKIPLLSDDEARFSFPENF